MKKAVIIKKIGSRYGVILWEDCVLDTYGGPVKFDPDLSVKTGTYHECRKWVEERRVTLIKGVK